MSDILTWPATIIFEDGTEKSCDSIHDVPTGRPFRRKGERGPDDLLDLLILVCDSRCGAMQAVAHAWYRARQEFDLSDDDPYEAIKRLRAMIDHLEVVRLQMLEVVLEKKIGRGNSDGV